VLSQIGVATASLQATGLGETAPAWQLEASWGQDAQWTDHFFVLGVRDLLQWVTGSSETGPLSGHLIADVDQFELDTELRFGSGHIVYQAAIGQHWKVPGPYAEGCHFARQWLTGQQPAPLCSKGHGPYQCMCGPVPDLTAQNRL
jgi:hypothetical protein